jgi:hypothetical protein
MYMYWATVKDNGVRKGPNLVKADIARSYRLSFSRAANAGKAAVERKTHSSIA